MTRHDAYDEKAKRYRDAKTGRFRPEKGQAYDYSKVVVHRTYYSTSGGHREKIDVRTTLYGKTRHEDQYELWRKAERANDRKAKEEGFETPRKGWSREQKEYHKIPQKDWQNERVEAKVRTNRTEPEAYKHQVLNEQSKWVEI